MTIIKKSLVTSFIAILFSMTSIAYAETIFAPKVLVDAIISGDQLTEANNRAIKVVEYNQANINYNYSFNEDTHIFTAPAFGVYQIDARYAQLACGVKYLLRIGISMPNATPPGGNASLGPVNFVNVDTGCAIPGIAAINGMMELEQGDQIFIQARYQRAMYDISRWNYKNEYQNRLVITYLGEPTFY